MSANKEELIRVRTDRFTKRKVSQIAKRKGKTVSKIVRTAISEYVERQEEMV